MRNVFLVLACCLPTGFLAADDWPQWMGPTRNGIYRERDVQTAIPESGLPVVWRQPIAGGYAGPAVAGGKVFVTDYLRSSGEPINAPDARPQLNGRERIHCFNAKSGELLWQFGYERSYGISYPAGPRCTPTVANGRLFTLGAEGDLYVLNADNGEPIWHRHLPTDFNVATPTWGFTAHPLVAHGMVYTMVGGEDQAVVALDAQTGERRWSALTAKDPGYCPPAIIEVDGEEQLIVFTPAEVAALDPLNGHVLWTLDLEPQYGMSLARPQVENDLLYASAIGTQAVMARLKSDPPRVEELWRGEVRRGLYSGNSTPLIVDGVIYGSDCQIGSLIAVDATNGRRLWETFQPTTGGDRRKSHGTAFLTYHEPSGTFYILSETGDLITARLSREKYEETGRFPLLEPTSEAFGRSVLWSHPAYAGQTVFARNDNEIVAVDLSR